MAMCKPPARWPRPNVTPGGQREVVMPGWGSLETELTEDEKREGYNYTLQPKNNYLRAVLWTILVVLIWMAYAIQHH